MSDDWEETPVPWDGHEWEGRLDDFVLSGCFRCGAPLASHTANQIKREVPDDHH